MNINEFVTISNLHLETDKPEIFYSDTEIPGLYYFQISVALFYFLKSRGEVTILEIVIFNDYFFGDSTEIFIFKFLGVLYP